MIIIKENTFYLSKKNIFYLNKIVGKLNKNVQVKRQSDRCI